MSPNLRLSQCATCTPRAAVRQFSIAAEALLNPRSPTSFQLAAVHPGTMPVPGAECDAERLNATRAPRFGRRLKPPRSARVTLTRIPCSHAENLNCLGRFGTRRFDSDR